MDPRAPQVCACGLDRAACGVCGRGWAQQAQLPPTSSLPNLLATPLLQNVGQEEPQEQDAAEPGKTRSWIRAQTEGYALPFIERLTPCTRIGFHERHKMTGTRIFSILEEAALDDSVDLDSKLAMVAALGEELADAWEASYELYGRRIVIHAIHWAASLGSVRVLRWLRDKLGRGVLDRKATLISRNASEPHATPLLCALYMGKTEAAHWLLDQGADATAANADGYTPMHMLASFFSLPPESAHRRAQALEGIAAKLVEKRADLEARVGPLEQRTDSEAMHHRNRTPLQLGAGKYSAYPAQELHVLTRSFHFPSDQVLFKEVNFVAEINPSAAECLLLKMKERDIGQVRQQLCQEVMELAEQGLHMEKFISILKMSPITGVRLLEMLLFEPKVTDRQRYPLPLYTVLPNREMLCAYQPAEHGCMPAWEATRDDRLPEECRGASPPKWHSEFRKDLPADPLLHTDVYEVKVQVLHLPGVVNLRVLSILSMLQSDWEYLSIFGERGHLSIFGKVSVNGIITWIWSKCRTLFYFSLAWECLLVAVLMSMGVFPPSDEDLMTRHFMFSVIIAHWLCAVCNLLWCLTACERLTGIPRRTYLLKAGMGELTMALALILLMHIGIPPRTGWEKAFIALNLLLRCFGLMSMCSVVPVIGPLMIAVRHSFIPMQGMFLFMAMVFATFAFAFIIFRDEGRSIGLVLLYLYQSLFLTDTDAARVISGLDWAHEQTKDFKVEMFTGSGDEWVLMSSTAVTILASSIFSLVLLNLTIGMYTNFYQQMEPLAKLIFQQQRARRCVSFMVQPAWQMTAWIRSLNSMRPAPSRMCVALAASACLLLLPLLLLGRAPLLLGGLALASAQQLCQAALLFDVADIGSDQYYLWISHRTDYEELYQHDYQQGVLKLEKECEDIRRELASVSDQLSKTNENMMRLLARTPA